MKKKLLSGIVALALFAGGAIAQESGFGAKLGLNLANLNGGEGETSMRTSLHLGGYYTYMLSDNFAIQPELVYSGQGAKGTQETVVYNPITGAIISSTKVDVVEKLDYINIPILAKYYFNEGFSAFAGIQLGLLMSAKYDVDGNSTDVKEYTNGTDFSIPIGVNYQLSSGLNFDVRYNIGMSAVNKEGDDKVTNAVIQIGVGYQFGM